MATLYRPPRMQLLEKTVRRGRERLGARLYPTDNSGVRALLQALKKGEMVGILPDQEPGVGQGVFAPFFGFAAYSMTLVSRLAQKTGAEVVFAYAERLPKGAGYRIHFLPAPEGIDSGDTLTSVTALNRGVEHAIRQCPTQYQWGYRRFRTRPPGDLRFY